MTARLTETFVKTLEPPARGARLIWDAELTGFAVEFYAPTRARPTNIFKAGPPRAPCLVGGAAWAMVR